jgi:hypothetical protein
MLQNFLQQTTTTTINFDKGVPMNTKKLITLACLAFMSLASAQEKLPTAADTPDDRPLGGFPGCMLAPAKDSCEERITCKGVGKLFGNSGTDLQDATDEAESEANAALAKFYSNKVKAEQAIQSVSSSSSQNNAQGGNDVKNSAARLITKVRTQSSEAMLTGVQVLGRSVDFNQRAVTIKVGVSCKSQTAAARSQSRANAGAAAGASSSGNQQPVNQGPASMTIGPMNQKNFIQKNKNSDDF